MKKISIFLFFASILFLFHSCSTDFDVIAPYKETMVIYGLLNPKTNVQYIRINKAFLGDGNSLIMAQQKDSINYGDVLDVKIQRIKDGITYTPFNLIRDTSFQKDAGIFNYPFTVLYRTSPSNQILTDGSTYKLIVHNNQTGLTATSETHIISNEFSDAPLISPEPMRFTIFSYFPIDFVPDSKFGWVYNVTIRFHYKEVTVATNDTISKYVDWNLGDKLVGAHPRSIESYSEIFLPDIYRIIGNAIIPQDTNVIRRLIPPNTSGVATSKSPVEIIYTAGTEELYTYQQLAQPQYGLVQDRPSYSNINNGVGLFACRSVISIPHNLQNASRAAFDTSTYTRHIHFF